MLGANDGIVSMASLLVGVAAAGASPSSLLATGVTGLVAGAMSKHDALGAHAQDGSAATRVGGAGALVGAGRVVLWGAGAMALTAMVGNWFGAVV